jgi:hypothetical protein
MKHSLPLAALALTFAVEAAPDMYHCEIQQRVTVRADGSASVSSGPFLENRRISINRKSGEKVGNAIGYLQSEGPKVLAPGNESNSFIALWLGQAYGGGVHLDLLRVEEFAPGPKKPFLALAGGSLFVGLCE